ncbi:MAG: PAS domain S-box protein, partial [Desulfuromonadales bacterium]|nr:PAS domain S-box protein [Desulfuromonadales bacterium]
MCSWVGPVFLTVAFIAILGSLLYLVGSRQLEEKREDLSVTLTNIQLKLQNRLNANREFLKLLGAQMVKEGVDMKEVRSRAGSFVLRHDELVAIRWADADLIIRWSAPPIVYRGLLDLQVRLPAPQRAARLARELKQPYYTRHFVPLQGESALEIYVPIFDGERFRGMLIGTYSTDELLLYGGTAEVFEHYQLCLVDGEERLVGQCIAWDQIDRRLRRVSLLHPEIEDVFLRVTRYKSEWGWGLKFLASLSIILAIGMGWGLWGLNRVIARRRKVEEELRDSEEKYRLLFTAESDAILVFDGETSAVVEANDAAVALYGWSREELLNLTARDLTTRPHLAEKRISEVLEGGLKRIPLDFQNRKDGSVFPAEISTGTFNWNGRAMFVGLVRDITERRRGEQLKEEMLSAVSHEMRTPLTAILGFSEYLLGNDVDEKQGREYLEVIHRESARLESLINNLLNLQRLRSGYGIGEFVEVDLPQMYEELIQL